MQLLAHYAARSRQQSLDLHRDAIGTTLVVIPPVSEAANDKCLVYFCPVFVPENLRMEAGGSLGVSACLPSYTVSHPKLR